MRRCNDVLPNKLRAIGLAREIEKIIKSMSPEELDCLMREGEDDDST